MRTTVRLNENLLRQAKQYALDHNQTLTDLIEIALRQVLQSKPSQAIRLPTRELGQPLVELDFADSSAIQDFLDHPNVYSRR